MASPVYIGFRVIRYWPVVTTVVDVHNYAQTQPGQTTGSRDPVVLGMSQAASLRESDESPRHVDRICMN